MSKKKFSIKKIPSWVVTLTIFGLLYITGLHTEAIGQVQRLLLATGLRQAEVPEAVAAEPNAPAPAAAEVAGSGFQMVDLEGNTVAFESLRGKVIFLNIWATWCPPCVAEMPNIQRLYRWAPIRSLL
ncbi:TlpA family protein disulfide reductase [Cesiribacter andamanensis]|uniref:Cytochrome c biogenesis protein tlpA n=1 Tax=Cesiribacter andamanensis AMV16 TaxID=1279009 RepID=M7N7Y9_9BACT|nr:TlpA disulfide reductase family protein [Cesiribacter andamanensis]EMR03321.1 Cytochrome c biogenesis protein tlpA [Cesiribacter andamanensis AMV16]